MRNINMKNAKFFVQPDSRKTICVIEGCTLDFINFIYDKTKMSGSLYQIEEESCCSPYLMPDSFTGIATCSEEDEWNEKIGKMVAFNKAKEKWGNSFFKRANKFMNYYNEIFEETCDLIDNFGKSLEDNLTYRSEKIKKYFEEKDKSE